MERRLAAIFFADVVNYSRSMQADEEGTLTRLKAMRAEIIDPTVVEFNGRIVKLIGDGMLIEFTSAVDAVRCAAAIQGILQKSNAGLNASDRLELRIGVNVGDVMVDGDDLYGDGVNVASRLESLAPVGGICISGATYDQVLGKTTEVFDYMGEQSLKGFPEKVRAYASVLPDQATSSSIAITDLKEAASRNDLPSTQEYAGAAGPMVAVLPLVNLNQDPDQDFFTDGLTTDIILGLSASHTFQVIAGTATAKYKGKTVDPQIAGEELGAKYVLTGNIRRAGNRLRAAMELINVENKVLLWTEHYDRALDDLFAVQDEITTTVVAMVEPEIDTHEMRRFLLKHLPASMTAYEFAQRGFWQLGQRSPEGYDASLSLFQSSQDADPSYPRAYAGAAQAKFQSGLLLWGLEDIHSEHKAAYREAIQFGKTALDLDQQDPRALRYFGSAQAGLGQHDVGLQALRRAVKVHPSYATAYSALGYALMFVGDFDAASTAVETTERLRPGDPSLATCMVPKSVTQYQLGNYEAAAQIANQAIALYDQFWFSQLMHVASLGQMGDVSGVRAAKNRMDQSMPQIGAKSLYELLAFKDTAHIDHIIEGLRKAGMVE